MVGKDEKFERAVLLNRLVSRSVTKAPREHSAPIHSFTELLHLLNVRRLAGHAIEYIGIIDNDDEIARVEGGLGSDFIRFSDHKRIAVDKFIIDIMLFEFADSTKTSFPVVHRKTFTGREIEGAPEESGALAVHVAVRSPFDGDYDDGSYRCCVEVVSGLHRSLIEQFLSRQLRRECAETYEFTVQVQKGKRSKEHKYKYYPKLQFLADFGRSISKGDPSSLFSHMVFTKRNSKQNTGEETDVDHEDFVADLEVRVSGKQAPDDEKDRTSWFSKIRKKYETLGYETKVYFRSARGKSIGGKLDHDAMSAADLLMCPREHIEVKGRPKGWRPSIDENIVQPLVHLLGRDELWERGG